MNKKYKYLEPEAKKAIDLCAENKSILLSHIGGFMTDKEARILKDMLWYAYHSSVEVRFIPKESDEK